MPALPSNALGGLAGPLREALQDGGMAVLSAPPGAGKTTQVPLMLLADGFLGGGRILMLEPRRLAARASAKRMADLLGEPVGATVGYRVRFDSKVSSATRIEVVTEGILTRMLHTDAELPGVDLVVFDELHERNLHSDLALALLLDSKAGLRPEIALLAMSATLDTAKVSAALGGAPCLSVDGQGFPVETHYCGGPPDTRHVAQTVARALVEQGKNVLVFLSGMADIRAVARELEERRCSAEVVMLHGGLSAAEQDHSLSPGTRRRVILSTNVAETSLTIEGVGAVVDAGLARVPRFDPTTGLTRLVTERISRSSATQRAGRAGRLGPGMCFRLWHEHEHEGREPHTQPEILRADLAPLALDLGAWGVADPAQLTWLDTPPNANFAQARELLLALGAVDDAGRITSRGRAMASWPAHPRVAAMLSHANGTASSDVACTLAAILEEDGPWRGSPADRPKDIEEALTAIETGRQKRTASVDRGACARITRTRDQLMRRSDPKPKSSGTTAESIGALLARAYPDRIAAQRGTRGRYVFVGGRAAQMDVADPLAKAPWLVAAHAKVATHATYIQLAAAIDESDVRHIFGDRIEKVSATSFDTDERRVISNVQVRLGRLVLETGVEPQPDPEAVLDALIGGVATLGMSCLPWTNELHAWRDRVMCLRAWCPSLALPDIGDATLRARMRGWLGPYLYGCTRVSNIGAGDFANALKALVDRADHKRIEEGAPTHITLPNGKAATLEYAENESPVLALSLQDAFGLADSPRVAWGEVPITLALLSPAKRPVQVTQDLAGFWSGSYAEVRKEMRGRYPKHYWPEDPASAAAHASSLKRKRNEPRS